MTQLTQYPSRLHKPYYRNGENHRSGADVSFKDIQTLFGFKTIEIGNWVAPNEQQIVLTNADDVFGALGRPVPW